MNFRKSSYSGSQANCVEVGHDRRGVVVRDTKHRDGAELRFSRAAWRKLVESVKSR